MSEEQTPRLLSEDQRKYLQEWAENNRRRETEQRGYAQHMEGIGDADWGGRCSEAAAIAGRNAFTIECALFTVEELTTENERLRAKLQEQENIIASLQAENAELDMELDATLEGDAHSDSNQGEGR